MCYFINLGLLSLLASLAKCLSILFIFSKNQLFVSLFFCVVPFISISLISSPIFIIYFNVLILSLAYSSFVFFFFKILKTIIK